MTVSLDELMAGLRLLDSYMAAHGAVSAVWGDVGDVAPILRSAQERILTLDLDGFQRKIFQAEKLLVAQKRERIRATGARLKVLRKKVDRGDAAGSIDIAPLAALVDQADFALQRGEIRLAWLLEELVRAQLDTPVASE